MIEGFHVRAAEYVSRVQALQTSHTKVFLEHGLKYVRVVRFNGTQNTVHSFLRYDDGAVLKSESWRKPALKHPRSNLFDADYGMSGVGQFGANEISN